MPSFAIVIFGIVWDWGEKEDGGGGRIRTFELEEGGFTVRCI